MDKRIFCPTCQELDLRSTIRFGGGFTTAMGTDDYVDEDGRVHHHDPNITTHSLRCSNGHEWTTSTTHPCPAFDCRWPS